jgi:hypothetical protein
MMDVQIVGLSELVARLESMDSNVWSRIAIAMDGITDRLADRARSRMAELFANPGVMQASVATSVDDGPPVTGTVGAYGLPYLAAQEFGVVTRPHDIFPVNAQVLAFFAPGFVPFKSGAGNDQIFAKAVHHPGSRIPERSYMRSALAMERTDIIRALQQAVDEGTKP